MNTRNVTDFLTHLKNVSACNGQCVAHQVADCLFVKKKLNVTIFSDIINHDKCQTLPDGSTH